MLHVQRSLTRKHGQMKFVVGRGFESMKPRLIKKSKTRKTRTIRFNTGKSILNFDLDKDGVPNHKDCNPYDPKKQDFGGLEDRQPRFYRGYNVEDWYFTGSGYELISGAKKEKKGLFG